jgi:hypothetical protein
MRTRAHMNNAVRRWFAARNRELSDDRSFCSWKSSYVALASNFFQIRSNQPSMAAALNPDLIQMRREARVGCCDVHQSGHYKGVPANIRWYLLSDIEEFDTHCTCTALLIVPVVVLGGKIPTNALSKFPRSKLTAPRPELGGASSCQHSRRAVLFAAEMAVTLKAAAWLATPLTRASKVVIEINLTCIVTYLEEGQN